MGKKDINKIKRIIAVLLCAFVFISFTPDLSFAIEGEEGNAAAVEVPVTPDAETVDAAADDTAIEDPEPVQNAAAVEESDTVLFDGSAEDFEAADLAPADSETLTNADGIDDPDSLLEGYMDTQLKTELGSVPAAKQDVRKKAAESKRRDRLNDNEKLIYDNLKVLIDKVAEGNASSATVTFDAYSIFKPYLEDLSSYSNYYVISSESLGISEPVLYVKKNVDGKLEWTFSDEAKEKLYNLNDLVNALMADEPYALYWYDKTVGMLLGPGEMFANTSGSTSNLYFPISAKFTISGRFTVAEAYRAAGSDNYAVDTTKTGATKQAVANAADIITENAEKTDYAKLVAYKNRICEFVSYDHNTAGRPYGDPWQMIYVFDGNLKTNVVCEGYSKAFQYLCDHTNFNNGLNASCIECNTVSGEISAGRHMWNILHMDDGKNYIVDITNSDAGMIAAGGGLFLSPAMKNGSVYNGYYFDITGNGSPNIKYTYDVDTLSTFDEAELTLAETEYCPHTHVISDYSYKWAEDGNWCAVYATCSVYGEEVIHWANITSETKISATCTEWGITKYKASFTQKEFEPCVKEIVDIPALGHNFSGVVTTPATVGLAGVMTYTCTRCGAVHTAAIPAIVYPQDLPAVKIVKPKAGKKKATVKWKKVSKKNQKKIQGIEIQVATDPGFTNIVKTATGSKKKTSKVVKGLKKKTRYYVRIRAYKNAADGKHVSAWKTKKFKIK